MTDSELIIEVIAADFSLSKAGNVTITGSSLTLATTGLNQFILGTDTSKAVIKTNVI